MPVRFKSEEARDSSEDDDSYATVGCSEDSGAESDAAPDGSRRRGCRAFRHLLESDPKYLAFFAFFAWVVYGLCVYTLRPWGADKQPYTVIEAIYLMAQIITTVGYGDETPICQGGMMYTCCYILFAVLVLSSLLTALTEHVLKRQQKAMEGAIKTSFGIQSESRGKIAVSGNSRKERRLTRSSANVDNNVDVPQGWMNLLWNCSIWSFCVFIGALFMFLHPDELPGDDEWQFRMAKAIYFSIITLTTVGFGDVTPQTQAGKLFCAFWMLIGVSAFGLFVSSFSAVFMARRSAERLRTTDRAHILRQMDRDNDGAVGLTEFMGYMLHMHGIGDAVGVDSLCEIIDVITKEFKDLDKDGSGELDCSELTSFDEKFLLRHKSGVADKLMESLRIGEHP